MVVMCIKKIIAACLAALLLAALGLFLFNRFGGKRQAEPEPTPVPQATVSLVIDPNIGYTPTPAPAEPGVAIPGWGNITLPKNSLEADTDLFNPEDNADWYYLTFQLRLKDTDEVVFQTGLIPPGMYCTKVTLEKALEAGTYAGVMHVQPYYMREPPTPTNNADFDIQIIVQ